MIDSLPPEFIATTLEELINEFEDINIGNIDILTEFLLSLWVLLDVTDEKFFDENDNIIKDTVLYRLNDEVFEYIIANDLEAFKELIKRQLITNENYEVLALMKKL